MIVNFAPARLCGEIGGKFKYVETTNRFESAGSWNSIETHCVNITDAMQVDGELMKWRKQVYEKP